MVKQIESSSPHFMPCLDSEQGTQHLLFPHSHNDLVWMGKVCELDDEDIIACEGVWCDLMED